MFQNIFVRIQPLAFYSPIKRLFYYEKCMHIFDASHGK